VGASRSLEITGLRIEDCLPGYGQASLAIRRGTGGAMPGPPTPWRSRTEARNRTVKLVRIGSAGCP
jgi:hypothetical protein